MKLFQRALIHTRRRPGKVFLLFALVFLLSTLTASAISIRQAILNTDQNLRSRLPAIAMIRQDVEGHLHAEELAGDWIQLEGVHASMIREIGALPYVRMFDYTTWGFHFFSPDFVRAFQPDMIEDAVLVDQHSLRAQGIDFEQFILKGVHHPDVADIEAELIELIDGRVFTESEIDVGAHVTLVSQDFLIANGLQLGDMLILDYKIYGETAGTLIPERHFSEDNLLGSKTFELEIIGVFDHTLPESTDQIEVDVWRHFELLNRMYVPNVLIESTIDLYIEALSDVSPELLEEVLGAASIEDMIQYENMIYLLYDPTDLATFRALAEEILPEFWVMSDLSNAYAEMSSSMEMINEIANGLLIGAVLATVLTLGLLLILFLRDRQQEIGIYLALGQKKGAIMLQMMVEVLAISLIAITFSLFVGNVLASEVSTAMIQHDLERQAHEERSIFFAGESLEAIGFRFEMTHEEMLEAYDVSFDMAVIITFYGVAITTIIVSAMIPIVYMMRLNPKDILALR